MPIRFQCEACGAGFKAADEQAGQQMPCPKCGSSLRVPVAQATLAPPDDPLDETESAALAETRVDPLAGVARKVAESKGQAPPPPPPVSVPQPQAASEPNAFQSPTARYEPPREADLTRVKIVGVELKFGTVFKLVFQMWVAGLALAFVLWVVIMLITLALGFGIAALAP